MQTLELVTGAGRFESLRAEWDDLLTNSDADCVFLTWEWLFTWWRFLSAGRELRIFTVRRHGELTAVAPLMRTPPDLRRFVPAPSLELMGTGAVGSDYLDIILRRGHEETALEPISQWMKSTGLMFSLAQLPSRSAAARLVESTRASGWSVSTQNTNVCPYIPLAGHSWDSFLSTLSATQRYGFRRQLRNLEKHAQVRLSAVQHESERRAALDRLWELHRARWDTRGGSDAVTPAAREFHDAFTELALQRGWLRLYTLDVGGCAGASLYGLRYRDRFLFYQAGFDPALSRHSVGMVTLALVIRQAIQENAVEFDMLHGNETYKSHWAPATRNLVRLESYPPHAVGHICYGGTRLNRWSRKLARALLPSKLAAHLAAFINRQSGKDSYAAHAD
jgi:CelD/BcsL family acetyltransferase involved in cellulose biosynthesis